MTACGLEGGDRTPLKNFLQPPVERCCEERPGSWVQLWGWDVIFQQALVKSRKSGRAGSEGEGGAQKPEGLRSQWDNFRRHRTKASGIQAWVEALAAPRSVTACLGHTISIEPHSCLLRRHL